MTAIPEQFRSIVTKITNMIGDAALDETLAKRLNEAFPADGETFSELAELCARGEREGWLMAHEAGGIKFGRAIKPGDAAGDFSVDVVRMPQVRGPHHVHPKGEIGAIMPISGDAKFDGIGAGWYVFGPGSAHHPTVTGGEAYVLYLLPEGAIEFTGKP